MKKIKLTILPVCVTAMIGLTGCEAIENSYNTGCETIANSYNTFKAKTSAAVTAFKMTTLPDTKTAVETGEDVNGNK